MVYDTDNKDELSSKVVSLEQYRVDNNKCDKFSSMYVFGGLNSKGTPIYGSRAMSGLIKKIEELNNKK